MIPCFLVKLQNCNPVLVPVGNNCTEVRCSVYYLVDESENGQETPLKPSSLGPHSEGDLEVQKKNRPILLLK
jgi:hypothetical protein